MTTGDGSEALGLELEGVGGGTAASGQGDPTSNTRVDMKALLKRDRLGTATIHVRLRIDESWHINANPASLEFLVPTTIRVWADSAPVAAQAAYPEPERLEVPLSDDAIAVYADTVTIPVRVSTDSDAEIGDGATVVVEVQACNDAGRCLAPATVEEQVIPSSGS